VHAVTGAQREPVERTQQIDEQLDRLASYLATRRPDTACSDGSRDISCAKLRGNLGTVKNVTSVLSLDSIPEAKHEEFLRMLKRSVSSLHTMLDDVMNLARRQAGHELRDVKPFDAAVVLGELCESLQLMRPSATCF
jgi:signal transduction histidine kinase